MPRPTIDDAKLIAPLLESVYDVGTAGYQPPPGWENLIPEYDAVSGLRAVTLRHVVTGRIVTVFAGLELQAPSPTLDASASIFGNNLPPTYWPIIQSYLNRVTQLIDNQYQGSSLLLVGHSLGGWDAQMGTAYIRNRIENGASIADVAAITANSFGAAGTLLQDTNLAGYAQQVADLTLNLVVAGDRVHTFTAQLGEVYQIGELSWWQKALFWVMDHLIPTRLDDVIYSFITADKYHAAPVARDKIAALPSLPPPTNPMLKRILADSSSYTQENAASLQQGAQALQTRQEIPVVDSGNPIPLQSAGEAYGLTLGANGQPATLMKVSVDQQGGGGGGGGTDWGGEGYLLGVDALGQSALAAKPGALSAVRGEFQREGGSGVGGAVELDLETIPESEVRAVDWNPDGSGWVDIQRGTQDPVLFPFSPADLIQIGTAGAETLTGFESRDVIIAGAGDDTISAGAGDDWVYADAGNDTVIGGEGNDKLYGGSGNDRLEGGEGDDELIGGSGDDVIYGGDGNDFLHGGTGEDWLYGGPGDDSYTASWPGITHIRDDDNVGDICYLDDLLACGDRLQFGPGVSPVDTEVTWSGNDVILRPRGGGGGGTVRIHDGLAEWNGDGDEHEIEYVEFADGTVWPWIEVLKRAEPLPEGDPESESGPPPELGPPMLRILLHGGMAQGASALDEIISIFDDAEEIISPIVFDLDGDGVETRNVDAGAHFDHNGNGFRERTGWVGADDGLLVWDRNDDGRITDGSELFGNRTLLPDGVTAAANGFAALAAWDANGDGKIDANDPVWANLRIWRDADSDGMGTPAEIAATPPDLGITAINTGYTTAATVDPQGNAHRQIGSFTRSDDSTGAAEDIWFKTDPVHSVAPELVPVPADVAALPNLPGYGTLYSLRQAMARDTSGTLKGLVAAFVAEADPGQRDLLVEQILFRWAGADTVDPASRGPLMDARQLALLEAFMGQGYVGYQGVVNPHHTSAPLLKDAYARLKEWTYAQLDIETHLADLYRLIPFSWDSQRGLVGDLAPVRAELQARLTANPVTGQRDLSEFTRSIRALKTEDMLGFWAFRDAFVTQDPAFGWVIDSGGLNQIIGTAASEGLNGTFLRDAIRGGDGNDTLWGQQGEDTLYGDAGRDILYGGPGDDLLVGGAGDDEIYGEAGRNRLEGGDGQDRIYGGEEADLLIGGTDNDFLYGNGGDDTLLGGPGDDSIDGGAGADTLDGGSGNNYANGGPGGDTYLFNRGYGTLTIQDSDPVPGVVDTIQLGPGILPADVKARRQGAHLVFTINGTTDQLGILNFFLSDMPDGQIEQVRFSDGTVWDVALIKQLVLQGTPGPDTLIGYGSPDSISGLDGSDSLYGRDGDDTLSGGPGNDSLSGEAGNDTLLGGTGDDSLYGGDGADTINGGGGWDYAEGGPGGDTYVFDRGLGTLTLRDLDTTPGVIDCIQLGPGVLPSDVTIWRNGDHLNLKINDTGDTLGVLYFFYQDLPDNQIEQIRFENGTSWGLAAIKQMVLTGTAAADTLIGYATADTLQGLAGNDTLWGRAGDDRLDGGLGADTLYGEAGNDTYVVESTGDVVVESAGNGTDTVESAITYTLPAEVENLTLTGSTAINATGNALANTLTGNSAANVLTGGAGNDTYMVGAGDTVVENANEGTDTVQSAITFTLPNNVENLVLTGTAAINGTGNTLNNSLAGNTAANVLSGGTGADTMAGGAGDDTYMVDNAGDVVTENVNEGTDTVQSSITYTLPGNIENLTLTGAVAINATGNALANTLTGNSAANVLTGGSGNDTYVVGAGDTVVENVNEGTDTVQSAITFTLPNNVENLVLTGTSAINATGNALNNSLTGNTAANTLNGGAGADTMAGGAGNDIYVVDSIGDVVTELASQGTDTVQASIAYTLPANVENLTLTGTAAINATGNTLANVLTGNSAANVLTGGAGNDTYVVDNPGDAVVENVNEGTDTVQSSITYTLPGNVENLTLTGVAAINATGNALANTLTGNSAANVLTGGLGNDTYVVGAGDTVAENPGEGTDTVQSSVTYTLDANVENLTLTSSAAINGTGNNFNNSLTGNTAANVLDGGAGNDTLTGGRGNDSYIFNPGWGQDTIVENDATAGNTDTALFGAPVRPLDLVLSRAGNNLALALHGTTDKVTEQSWYLGTTYQTEIIQAGDGSRLLSTQVDLLIQAMASYTATTGLTWDQAIDQRPQEVETVLAGYWQHP